jgi:hypothetical protein
MSAADQILADADAALAGALEGDERARLAAMTRFMRAFEELAQAVARGAASWDDARPWAQRTAAQLVAAEPALEAWELEQGALFYGGGEERVERALDRRSQHALARELFRGTPVDELLAAYEAADVDADMRDEAHRIALDGPSYLPRSHTWWRWS